MRYQPDYNFKHWDEYPVKVRLYNTSQRRQREYQRQNADEFKRERIVFKILGWPKLKF